MKRLLLVLILTFSFQTPTKADDIRDFQIEGMSIGDSLLDFFNEEEIIKIKNIDIIFLVMINLKLMSIFRSQLNHQIKIL